MSEDHLNSLRLALSHETARLVNAKSEQERTLRAVWVKQLEKEIAGELSFLGINEDPLPEMSDDELMTELDK